ncbi:MAG TPA: FadR/GntR family transcriptional regulator [Beijerinckiaceae bacterium]|nr:FadR/GntR family transcriptional regulator [Beijerinckiaceae bacterium]
MNETARSLRPVSGTQSRTADLVRMLSDDIRAGRIKPGEKLPTEQEIVQLTGVSRTVVREAVAALRAEGLVVTRQGVGAFVTAAPGQGLFKIASEDAESIERVLQILELRIGLEVEAAGLAARRADPDSVRMIEEAHEAFRLGAVAGEIVIGADYGFHKAICEATGNPYFPRILSSLGQILIPRQQVPSSLPTLEARKEYLAGIAGEHGAIFEAIARHDEEGARKAMRHHLTISSDRYRSMKSF